MAEEKMARRLFVGGLYDGITNKDLSDRFSRFGEVSAVDVRARKDNLGNILKTFAYLNMSISEKDYKKCMATFNKTTWRGNEMQIQLAKESFMDRLAREREAAKLQETCPAVKPVVEPVTLQVKGAPPGTAVEGKQDWVVGKYGRALPVVNIRTKNKKKVLTVDPSKYVHGVKKFDHGKKADMVETDPSPSIAGLTWQLEVEETDTLKKIKGEFPKSKKTPQKRKLGDDSRNMESRVNGKRESTSMQGYHSNSDSCTSDDEKTQITKKRKSALKSADLSEEKPSTVVKTPLANGKRKRTISDTSSPHDRKDTRSRAISPNVSIIEPQVNGTPTKVQKPSALDILKRLQLSSQKKVLDVKKCVSENEGSKVTNSKSVADNGVSKTVQREDKSPKDNKTPSKTKTKNQSSSISETQKTSWSPSIDVGSAQQSIKTRTPKATDILEKLKLASQQKQNVETTPALRTRDTSESTDVGADKQSVKTKTPNATDILEKLKRKQNVETTPTSRKSAESTDVGADKLSVKTKTPNATDILEKLKRKQNVDTTPTSRKSAESTDVGADKQSVKTKTPNTTDILEKLKRKQNVDTTPTSRKSVTSETSSVDILPPKEKMQKANKKSKVQPKSHKEDTSSSSDSEDEVNVRQSNNKSKSPKVPAVLTMETETQEKAPEKSKKPKSQKSPVANTVKAIQFDDDIGVDADDEEDINSRRPPARQPVSRRNPTVVQPSFAQVGSVDEFGVGVLVDENTRQLSEQEKKWNRYNSHTYSSDEDILDAAKAGSFTKLDRIAKLAQLGQKHIEINPALRSTYQLATGPKVYNSDSNSDGESFKQVQTGPKRIKEKSILPKVKNTQKRKQENQNAKSSDSDDTSSEDDIKTAVQQKSLSKDNSSTPKTKLLQASKQPESSDESSADEVQPTRNSESSSKSSESEAEEATNKSTVKQVKSSVNISNTKQKSDVIKKPGGDSSESSSESSTSSDEEAKEVKQKPQVQISKDSVVNKKRPQKEDTPKSSSESSTSSSDEEAVEIKQKTQVPVKKANPVVSKKEVQKENNSTSSSESTTSSDEEVTQVKQKPQISKKKAPKEESSSESTSSSDEEPTQSTPAVKKQKLPEESEEPRSGTTKAPVKANVTDAPKAKPDKPKGMKSKEAVNQLRLESLRLRNQEALAQKNLLKKALASVDANSSNSKKIRFDSDSEDEKMKMEDSSSSSESDSGNDSDTESSDEESQPKANKDAATKKPALFDEDSDESEDDAEDQFRVRPQFEGESGSKLIALQSRFGNDPRFKFTEKFLDSDNEEPAQESNAEEEMEVTEESTVTERDRDLAILKDVVGPGDGKSKKTKAVLFKDMATQQYDPTKDEHKQFEVTVEKKEKKKKKKEVPVGPEVEALPQVSGDRYFEVQNSLKDMFNKTDEKPFSLLAMLGRTADEPVIKGFSQQADGKGQVFQHVKSPWQQQFGSDGESSGDEHGDTHDNTSAQQSEANKGTTNKRDSIQRGVSHGFFFVDNDPRIADGVDFFRRHEDIEQIREKWAQERPDLVEAYRNKRKRFRFMKKEGTTPNYKGGFNSRGGKRGGGRGRR